MSDVALWSHAAFCALRVVCCTLCIVVGLRQSRTIKESLPFLHTRSPCPRSHIRLLTLVACIGRGGAEHWAHRRAPLRIVFSRVVGRGARGWGKNYLPHPHKKNSLTNYLVVWYASPVKESLLLSPKKRNNNETHTCYKHTPRSNRRTY
jgi:hypothetical protein